MRRIIMVLILLPCFAFAPQKADDYSIYSQYLRQYQANRKAKRIHFVIRESPDSLSLKAETDDINDAITSLKNYLTGDVIAKSDVGFLYESFADSLKRDTTWLGLVVKLSQKIKGGFVMESKFPGRIKNSLISNDDYHAYFNSKDFKKNWAHFYGHYSKKAYLVQFSPIAADSIHAVFYFTARCAPLCAEGRLVFAYRESGVWKFISTKALWVS